MCLNDGAGRKCIVRYFLACCRVIVCAYYWISFSEYVGDLSNRNGNFLLQHKIKKKQFSWRRKHEKIDGFHPNVFC